jgi:hypothetical protein
MAWEIEVLDVGGPAIEDLSEDQFKFVVRTSTGWRRPNSASEFCEGILQNAPGEGQACSVRVLGYSKFVGNAALGVGTFLMTEYVDAADAGKAADAVGDLAHARAVVAVATEAEDELGTCLLIGPVPAATYTSLTKTETTEATADAVTHDAAAILGGLILRDPAGAARADLFPAAADIVGALSGAIAGSGFEFTIRNTADAEEPITMTTNTGLTLTGDMVIKRNSFKRFLAIVTDAGEGTEAVSIYDISSLAPDLTTVTTEATAGAVTYTAAQIMGGLILRDPAGANRADVFPTAANLLTAVPGAKVGQEFFFTIKNTADAEEIITMSTAAGLTLSGNMAIGRYQAKRFRAVFTNVTVAAVTIYDETPVAPPRTAVTTDATAGANTWTAAELLGGLLLRDPAGASRLDVSPDAADIVAAIPNCVAGSSFPFTIKNTADGEEIITLTAGSGITLSGNMAIDRYQAKTFLARVTNAGSGTEAVTIYDVTPALPSRCTVTTEATADAVTYTAAEVRPDALILRDPNGAGRADLFPTAAQIVAAIPNCLAGSSFEFDIINTANGDETITMTTNDGLTLVGTMTIGQTYGKRFRAVATNVGAGTEAVSIYSLGLYVN